LKLILSRYFFHATDSRRTDPDYAQSDSDESAEEDFGMDDNAGSGLAPPDYSVEVEGEVDSGDDGMVKEEREVETDPESAEEFDEDAAVIDSDDEEDLVGGETHADSELLDDSEVPPQRKVSATTSLRSDASATLHRL
jgi:hypothetical protein